MSITICMQYVCIHIISFMPHIVPIIVYCTSCCQCTWTERNKEFDLFIGGGGGLSMLLSLIRPKWLNSKINRK